MFRWVDWSPPRFCQNNKQNKLLIGPEYYTYSVSKLVRFPIEFGIVPVNRLKSKVKVVKLRKFPIDVGKEPVNALLLSVLKKLSIC